MINSNVFKTNFIIFITVCFCAISSPAGYTFKSSNGHVSFLAIGRPSAIKIRGQGSGPQGSLAEKNGTLSGELTFDLNSLETGIEMRDHHMKEKYLEVSKFPNAKLKIQNLKSVESGKDLAFSALLTLKGIEKPVQGTYSVVKSGSDSKVEVSFPLKLSDFQIEIPSYAGITVAEEVNVQVTSSLTRSTQP